ncbi:uncharacterized protein LOC131952831 isoform X2 [Physella acuta]|uniref:uncharacterized protein LOC131952831 isoform X2 n=1 Tax=Physella acuta TaxID=109671 RepID=UPI0027DBA8C4|nr:uncharacterized protein LOC131952831 isoform X2 [Physella acuta]
MGTRIPIYVLLLSLPSILAQVALPPRPLGFVYNHGSLEAKVHLDLYIDLICPDSRAAYPTIKQVAENLGPSNLRLTVYIFPLPYHQNSFYVSKATFVVHKLSNGTKTFDWIEKVMLDNLDLLTDGEFHNKSDADLLSMMAPWAESLGLDKDHFTTLVDRRNRNEFELYPRYMFKYACTRGVAGTATYFINGFANSVPKADWLLSTWMDYLNPLFAPQAFDLMPVG